MVSETRRVCRELRPVSLEEGVLESEVPTGCGLPRTSLRRVLGLARPNQSAGRAEPSFRLEGSGLDQARYENVFSFYILTILHLEPWCTLAGVPLSMCIPFWGSVVGGDWV